MEPTSNANPATEGELGILQRRKIEAAIIAPIYAGMVKEIGEARAQAILDEAISKAAIDAGQSFAAKTEGGANLLTFQALQSLWTKDDALKVEIVRADATHFDYNVKRCRYAETYREMGLGKIGHLLSCNRDGVFCQGYNPDIKLQRTQTLMQGADHCDFRYTYEPGSNES
jgi:hypothetical protein